VEIHEDKKGQVVILSINGRLDSTNSSELERKVHSVINRNEKKILIDCNQLTYVSSSGLRVFLTGLKKMSAIQGIFALCSLQESVKEIFDISGFTGIFTIYVSQQEALSKM
jgi:anti-sigma B factor antagonist